jgi:hypothetical protein
MTHANIDMLSETRYYIDFDAHAEGVCLLSKSRRNVSSVTYY